MAGYSPIVENMILTRDADYLHIFKRDPSDPPFPANTTAEIVITETRDTDSTVLATWDAEDVSPDEIAFWVQSEDTNEIDARTYYRLLVHYPPSTPGGEPQDWCWYRGQIKREQ